MKNILNYDKFLEEVQLTLSELDKNNGERGNVLIRKLKEHEPLTTIDNRRLEIDQMKGDNDTWVDVEDAIANITNDDNDDIYNSEKSRNYFKSGRYYRPIFKSGATELPINKILKTQDFGSKGAGRLTKHFETLQTIFLSIRQNARVEIQSDEVNLYELYTAFVRDFTENGKIVDPSQANVFIPDNSKLDDDFIDDFIDNQKWLDTFSKVPNTLWTQRLNLINTNREYLFYHTGYKGNDSPFTAISKKYKQFSRNDDPDLDFRNIDFNKYCPADVYIIDKIRCAEIVGRINNVAINSLVALSTLIDELFDAKLLIPISLKMISGDNFKIITNREPGKELPDFLIRAFMVGDNFKGLGSKISTTSIWKHRNNTNVDRVNRIMAFDTSNSGRKQNLDGEIEGSQSRHGKISFIALERIIRHYYNNAELDYSDDLHIYETEELREMVVILTNELRELKRVHGKLPLEVTEIRRGHNIENNKNKLISRIQSLQIIKSLMYIYSINAEKANIVMTAILRYALSIQSDKFDTPRYLRVI